MARPRRRPAPAKPGGFQPPPHPDLPWECNAIGRAEPDRGRAQGLRKRRSSKQGRIDAAVNIDERLEALTQTVELIASLHKDNEERFKQYAQANDERFGRLTQAVERLAQTVDRNEERAGQLMDTMNRLGRILEIHDETIDEHTDRIDRLEGPR